MADINLNELWFQLPDSHTLCRAGGNGPKHISQMYAVKKYLPMAEGFLDTTFLDYGAGSATTYEALRDSGYVGKKGNGIHYRGLDVIDKNTKWCQENFPEGDFKFNPTLHKIDEPDKSWDVVYSRHVVDHMESFEKAMDEHKRVAKKLVIVILWTGFVNGDEHEIKNIVDQRGLPTEKLYPNEYTNNYSRKKVVEYLNSDPEWELLELNENVGGNQVIVLRRNNAS